MAAASSKGQGLLISLIVFVVLTVAMAVTAFLFYQEKTKVETELANAKGQAQKANTDKENALAQVRTLKGHLGFPEADFGTDADPPDGPSLMSNIKKHFNDFGPVAAPGSTNPMANPTYASVLVGMGNVIKAKQDLLDQKTAAFNKLQTDFDESRKTEAQKLAEHDEQRAKSVAELAQEQGNFRREVNGKEQLIQEFAGKANQQAEEKRQVDNNLERLKTKSSTDITALRNEVHALKGGLERLESMGSAVGSVVSVEYDSLNKQRFVYVDVGEAEMLRLQTTFSVWAPDKNATPYYKERDEKVKSDADKEFEKSGRKVDLRTRTQGGPKAYIEVVKVMPKQGLARVTMSTALDPIAPGDLLFSPIWAPGQQKHFALVGRFDLTGKGTNDRELLMRMIKNAGGVIDCWVDDEGVIQPKDTNANISVHTSWFVEGTLPDQTDPTDPQAKYATAVLNADRDLRAEAKNLAVQVIDLAKFLDYMGYKPNSREYETGSYTGGPEPANRFENPTNSSRPTGLPTRFENPDASTRPRQSYEKK